MSDCDHRDLQESYAEGHRDGYAEGWRDALRLAADECEAQEMAPHIVRTLRLMADQKTLGRGRGND
jgi:hypothetical protein